MGTKGGEYLHMPLSSLTGQLRSVFARLSSTPESSLWNSLKGATVGIHSTGAAGRSAAVWPELASYKNLNCVSSDCPFAEQEVSIVHFQPL
jgi:hypothetical protein